MVAASELLPAAVITAPEATSESGLEPVSKPIPTKTTSDGLIPPHLLPTLTPRVTTLILRHYQFLGSPPLTLEKKEAFVKRCILLGKTFTGEYLFFAPHYTKPTEAIPEWGQTQLTSTASAWEAPWGGYGMYADYSWQYSPALPGHPHWQVPMSYPTTYQPSPGVLYQGPWTGQPAGGLAWLARGNAVEMPMAQYPGRVAVETPAGGTQNGFDVTAPEFVPVTGNGIIAAEQALVEETESSFDVTAPKLAPTAGNGTSKVTESTFDVTAPEFTPTAGNGIMVDGNSEEVKGGTKEGNGVTDSGDASTNP
ncbi:hypothetical protein BJ508DRAFT_334026 [Ascobolus immersus RN42]|uniref:Uncharacterized protein n=1 Tax=Ascobolus immersus RN42 TaxID=1160509 RepID=A0A3N4HKS0_ASCIM|nr:hypothetical protein BJ508DRAFT_334026 [Ascobolus immersus RN42]